VPYAKANGINIFYEVHGSGRPLLIIAGLSIDITALDGLVTEFSKDREVITFDNRGAGRTDKPDEPYTVDMMADDAFALLETLGVRSPDVMGFSMGGKIALSLATRHPSAVRSLILTSTAARVQRTHHRRLFFVLVEVPRRVGALLKKYPQPNYAYRRQLRASEGYDATAALGGIRVPTLVLHGRKDAVTPYSLAVEMQEKIPGAKLVTLDGGHLYPLWHPKEFATTVEGFLDATP